jgi:ribosome biogenesis protein MAK21
VLQVFFHKYFSTKEERDKAKAAKVNKRKEGAEASESSSDSDGGAEEDANPDVETPVVEEDSDAIEEIDEANEDEIWKVGPPQTKKSLLLLVA